MENNNSTHFWRCMNCGEMTSSDICQSCGKPSYIKTEQDGEKSTAKSETAVKKANTAAANDAVNADVAALGSDIKLAVSLTGENACEEVKKVKKLMWEICGLTLALVIAAVVMCNGMRSKIDQLESANKDLKSAINSGVSKIKNEVADLKTADVDSKPVFNYKIHTVKPGETLQSICKQYGIDYYANKNIIIAINGIKNPSIINVGQNIFLPIFSGE